METNDNNNATPQNLWDAEKAVLRGKYTAIQAYLRKEQFHMNSLNSQLMKLEKEEQMRPKVNRRMDIINIRAEINIIERPKQRFNEIRTWFFNKIKYINT